MKRRGIRWGIFLIFLLAGYAWGKEQVKTGPVDFTLEPILSCEWVCYIQDGNLYIRSIGNTPVKIRDRKETTGAILSPALKVMGNSIFVTWIERGQGNNKVMFKVSKDNGNSFGKTIELTTNTKATQIRLSADNKKRLYILETSYGKDPGIYINLSLNRAETFRRIPLEADDIESLYNLTPVVVDDMLYLFFFGLREGKKHIGVKSFEIPSMKPTGYDILKEVEGVSFIEAFKTKGRPSVIYKTIREGKFFLEGFINKGTLWDAFAIKGAEGLDVARMDYYTWEDGRILVVFSAEERGNFKQRIYAAISEDGDRNWDVKRIDSKEFDNTRSWLPRMAVDGNKVVVVWEDSRDIRSGVRMKLSPDRGRTWMERDIPISNKKNYAFRPRISFTKGSFYIAWHQFKDDERKVADLVMVKLKWDEAVKIASKKEKGISLKKKEALLRERVRAYWEGMIKKDLKTTYNIHDPFYRARIPFDYYASHRGPMVYHNYNIESLKIEGNVASVRIKVKYDVPKIIMLGKEASIPPKEITIEETYLFIDGTWYRKFVDALSGGSAINY